VSDLMYAVKQITRVYICISNIHRTTVVFHFYIYSTGKIKKTKTKNRRSIVIQLWQEHESFKLIVSEDALVFRLQKKTKLSYNDKQQVRTEHKSSLLVSSVFYRQLT